MATKMHLDGLNGELLQAISTGWHIQKKPVYTKDLATSFKKTHQTITQHLDTLERNGYISRQAKGIITEIRLTPLGEEYINLIGKGILNKNHRGQDTLANSLTSSVSNRLHSLRITFRLFATEYSKIEALLSTADIPFKISSPKGYSKYIVDWQGHKLHITTKKLIDYAPDASRPFEVQGSQILDESLQDSLAAVAAFLQKTGIRCYEENGRIWCRPTYYEIAISNDQTAHEATKKHRYMPLAYDKATGKVILWADKSEYPVPESETNKLPIHALLQSFYGAMVDGTWSWQAEQAKLRDTIMIVEKDAANLHVYIGALQQHTEAYVKIGAGVEAFGTELRLLNEQVDKLAAAVRVMQTQPTKPASAWQRFKAIFKR